MSRCERCKKGSCMYCPVMEEQKEITCNKCKQYELFTHKVNSYSGYCHLLDCYMNEDDMCFDGEEL